MPPRLAKKTTAAKRKVSTPAASSPKVEMVPPTSTVSPAAPKKDSFLKKETTAPKKDSFLKKDQTRKPDPIITAGSAIKFDSAKEGESSQPDPAIRARPAKKRVVAKVAASTVKKEAVALVARDQIEQKTGSLSEKEAEAETEKSAASKDGRDCTVEEPIEEKPMEEVLEVNAGEEKEIARERDIKTVKEGDENTENIGGEKEIEGPVRKEVKDGEKIENTDTEELANGVKIEEQLVEEGEPIEEEAMEEGEPIKEEELIEEEEAMEQGEPIEEEAVEEGEPIEEEEAVEEGEPIEEEEAVEEGEPIEEEAVEEGEPIEDEPLEEEEEGGEAFEEEEPTEQEQVEEEPMEEEEEEEEPIEEEVGEGDGKEEFAKGRNNEEKREIVAVEDVQLASVDRGGGDHGSGDMPEPTMYLKALLPNQKVKDTQIFISQLEKTVVEEDIVKVFAGFGEIQSVRVIRHSLTQKSKGYAFLQYSTAEAVEKALSQLKDGTEIKGKTVHISASNQENCTIFVGNICKSWSKDQVLDALKGLGVEGIDQIALPEDPKVEGKIKGFAFVEFCTHIDAKAALNRLCKPDAVLGCDYSAKVSFAQLPVNHTEDLLAKVKTVYLEPVPTSWDGKKIEEICKEYGAIEKIKLYRKSKSSKKKDFAFVEFVSRESALNCVEGLSKALVDHDDTKVSASLARPYAKKAGTKFMLRGNFKVKKSNEKGEKEDARIIKKSDEKVEKEEARIIKKSDEKVEKEEVKIIVVSGDSKRKRKRPKSKGVIAQKSKPLSPQKTIKKNKNVHKKGPNIETTKETPHRHAPKKRPNKEAPVPVPVHPQGSRKRPFKEAPESSKRPFKGKMKHEKGMRGGPHPHQSGTKKSKPLKGSKQHQRGGPTFNNERSAPALNNERDFKRSRNDHYGDYHSHGSSIDRRQSLEYAYAPPSYTSRIHEPPYASSIREPPYTASMHEPSRPEPYTYASGSYHSHHSDLAPHAGYVPPTHHAPRTRHVYEPSAPAPYGGGYDRPIVYTREPPIPPTSHPGFVTYPRYQQPSYPYPTGGSYPADYAPRRSYY